MITDKVHQRLAGKANVLEWHKRLITIAKIRKWYTTSWDFEPFDYEKGIADNVAALNNSFGYGYLDPDQHLQTILDSVKFPIQRDPSTVFTWIDRQMAIYFHRRNR